jgi:uncharacterized membrane protein YqjE
MTNEQPEAGSPASDGVMASARRMVAQLLELLQLRVELLSTELETEKLRLLSALSHGLAALLLGIAGISMLSLALLLLTPDAWRWLSALGMSLLYFGLGWWFWWRARERLSQPGGVFAGTAAELQRDRDSLEP